MFKGPQHLLEIHELMYIQKYENAFSFFEYRISKAWDFFKCEFLKLFFLSWNMLMEFSLPHFFTWLDLIKGLKIIRGKEGSRQPNQLIFFSLGNKLRILTYVKFKSHYQVFFCQWISSHMWSYSSVDICR